ncbi:MAG: hypothetical protein ACE5HX_08225 [bacterium]
MQNHCVIIAGPTITSDEELFHELNKHVTTVKCLENSLIETLLATHKVDILLFEITTDSAVDMNIIKIIRNKFPDIEIILIDGVGNRSVLAQAFALGARDAFPLSYNRALLLERIQALLRQI